MKLHVDNQNAMPSQNGRYSRVESLNQTFGVQTDPPDGDDRNYGSYTGTNENNMRIMTQTK
jgi:hypothetical protein